MIAGETILYKEGRVRITDAMHVVSSRPRRQHMGHDKGENLFAGHFRYRNPRPPTASSDKFRT